MAAGGRPPGEVEDPRRVDDEGRHGLGREQERAAPPHPDAGEDHRDVAEVQEDHRPVEGPIRGQPHGQPREGGPAQARERVRAHARARAARSPLRTAPSMVAGRPVSVQSPASTRPRDRRLRAGAQALGGRVAGERRLRLAQDQRAQHRRPRHLREVAPQRRLGGRGQLGVGARDAAAGRAHDEGQVLRGAGAAVEPALVEHPLHLGVAQARHHPVHDHAVEPHLDGHDGRAA